jgi:predicted kinase
VPRPLLLIVTGPPCAGKTAIARRLSEALSLPLIGKDDIKEVLFDSLGWSDRAWSRKLSGASYDLIYLFLDRLLGSGLSCIAESNFKASVDSQRLRKLLREHDVMALQIWCKADGDVLLKRFTERWQGGLRHPGHVDDASQDELRPGLLRGEDLRLDIDGEVMEVDTTDFETLDFDALLADARNALSESEGDAHASH